jgi:hypothetical protein
MHKLHVGGVLDPGEACRNRVTLSIGRLGSDSGYSLVFGLFEKNECEEPFKWKMTCKSVGCDRRSDRRCGSKEAYKWIGQTME